ncbi:alanine racemase C-terminal domain-containing protein [Streptomyces sp. NPDC048434]|uniref:alanine racemase C-terminal domain-containing protein n=1 Tax=Streptomyces sp. NPDC048434 TaxID=3365549 RepID=UPI0037194FCB
MTFGIPREAESVEAGHGAAVTAVADIRSAAACGGAAGGPAPAAAPGVLPAGGSALAHHDGEPHRAGTPHAQARIDLAAIRANVSRLCDAAGSAEVMAVVKADGYGHVTPGDEVVLFGPGDRGEPGAQDWARAAHTIAHEIVSRIGARVPRAYTGGTTVDAR